MTPSEPQRRPVWCVEHHELSWLYSDGSLGCWYCLTVETGCHCTPGEPIITRREAQGIPPSEALRAALEGLARGGYQPMYNGRPSCPFCHNFVDDEETHRPGCVLTAAIAATPSGGIPLIDVELLQGAVEVAFEKGREWEPDPIHSFMNNPIWPYDKFTRILAAEYTRLASESSPVEEKP